jgi:SAM-dependent methyltransferase
MLDLLRADPPVREPVVVDDDADFDGTTYWFQHQQGDLGIPDIHARARSDMAERNLHWLDAVLKYKLPGARTLELGCGNGSFVGLMQVAGYDAVGSEMSPWVVEYGKRTFGAPILVGPVEDLEIAPASLDAVVMMDVLEHLPDPAGTLRRCLELLKADGVLVIQTPQYREGTTHAHMVESHDAFLEQLKPEEHLYLFTQRGVRRLLESLGTPHIAFEPAIFAHYDMFLVAGRHPLAVHGTDEIEPALLATPGGRIAQALLDLRRRELALAAELAKARSDVKFLEGRLGDADHSEALRNERNLLEHQLADLRRHFDAAEADRAARARVIAEQGQTISNLHAKVHAHVGELEALTERHAMLLSDYAQMEERMNELRRDYGTVVEDRATRGRVLDEHARTISTLQTQIDTRLRDMYGLREQLADVRRQLHVAEADRAARGEVIERQGRRASELEALVHEIEKNRDWHKAEAERVGGDLAALQGQLAEREEQIRRGEARWWHRLGRRLGLL